MIRRVLLLRCVVGVACLIFFSGLAAKDYRSQILRGQKFLEKNFDRLDADALNTLNSLMRVYGLRPDLPVGKRNILEQAESNAKLRAAGKDKTDDLSELEIRLMKRWPGLITSARFCDKYQLPWDFLLKIREESELGGYGKTRGLFALLFAEWKNCARDVAAFTQEKNRLIRELPEILQHSAVGSELWIECVLLLYLTEHRDWVTDDLLGLLAGAQRADGSWQGSYRMTARALWIFLEAEQNRVPQGKFRSIFLDRPIKPGWRRKPR